MPEDWELKRILHILSNTCLVINLIVFAILLPEIRLWTLGIAFVFTAYLFLQLFDKRKDQWAWWVIIFGIVLSLVISVCYILLFDLYLYFIVIAIQIIVSTIVFCIFKRKWYIIKNVGVRILIKECRKYLFAFFTQNAFIPPWRNNKLMIKLYHQQERTFICQKF